MVCIFNFFVGGSFPRFLVCAWGWNLIRVGDCFGSSERSILGDDGIDLVRFIHIF